MDNEKLREEYRKILITGNAVTIAFLSLVEIIAYIIFVHHGIGEFSIKSKYLWGNVILPIFINVVTNVAMRKINKSEKVSYELKNELIIYGVCVTACVVAIIHRDYVAISGAYVFPIVLSASYNRKRLLNRTFYIAIVSLTVTIAIQVMEKSVDLDYMLNTMVSYGFAIVSYLAGYISIVFSRKNSAVIENQASENTQLQSIILRDQMTGLYNHRAFYMELDNAISKSTENNEEFCVAMIDVDDFKKVNDKYGHDRGDDVLKALANVLKDNCDRDDKACRYGGEEFAIVFNKKSANQCEDIMNKILEEFKKIKYEFSDECVTFSCGVAQYNNMETRESFFNRADKYMYDAKRNGKNRVVALAM